MKIQVDMISLPRLTMPVHQMNQEDMRSFIPRMVQALTGQEKASKPKWWPEDLTWTNPMQEAWLRESELPSESLRNIITSCYKYYGQEHLLKGDPIMKASSVDGSSVDLISKEGRTFINDSLHQTNNNTENLGSKSGVLRPVQLFRNRGPAVAVKSTSGVSRRAEKTFVEIFICFFCEKEFQDKLQLQKHQQECIMRPSGIQLRSPGKAVKPYVPPVVIPRKRAPLKNDPYVRPKFSKFMEGLGLLSKSRAAAMRRNKSIECDIIDLTTEEAPRAPITPKSPRTLISQLSRDISPTGLSRLSFSVEPQEHRVNESGDDSDAENEQTRLKVASKLKMVKVASLLQIDLCSPLGQRLQNHIVIDKPEKHEPGENEHYEHFCRTPKKNESMARLRHRKDLFPNTFRRKRTRDYYYHLYKFNKKQKTEFKVKMKTGLSTRSRMLVKKMKRCNVLLPKLTETEIKELSKPRPYGLEWARLYGDTKRTDVYQHRRYVVNSAEELQQFLGSIPGSQGFGLNRLSLNHAGRQMTLHGKMSGHSHASNRELLRHLTHSKQLILPSHINSITCQQAGPSSQSCSVIMPGHAQRQSFMVQDLVRSSKRRREDDVISISSNDSDDGNPSDLHNGKPPAKKVKLENDKAGGRGSVKSQTVLFKCHLCAAEILFSLETTEFIRRHFADKHGVRNIRIMEQKDSTGQLVLSIVEDPPSRPNCNQNNKANLQNSAHGLMSKQGESLKFPIKPSSNVGADDVICIDD